MGGKYSPVADFKPDLEYDSKWDEKMTSLLTIIVLLNASLALAEYRVYEYMVYPQNRTAASEVESTEGPQIFLSSLSLQGFSNYKNIGIELIFLKRTWMCSGHTGHLNQYCASPYPVK